MSLLVRSSGSDTYKNSPTNRILIAAEAVDLPVDIDTKKSTNNFSLFFLINTSVNYLDHLFGDGDASTGLCCLLLSAG